MDDFIATALAEDPSIERARSNIAAAEEGVTAAKWQFGPTPSLSREPSSSGYVNVLRIQQPLYTGGALEAGLRSARMVVQGSQEELASAQMQLRIRLVTNWADWVKSRQHVASLQTLANQHEELLAMIQRRTDAGVGTVSDAALATSRLSAVQAELAQARLEEALQRHQLQRLARRPVEPPLAQALDGTLPDAPELATILDHIQTSPDMAIARASVDIAREDLNKAKASLLPTISLRMERQTGAVRDQSIGLVMQASFGGGLASFSSVNAARHRILAAEAAVSATEQDLFNRYQLEYTRYASACASARSAVATAEASDVVLASYRRQFAAGKRAWLDLLNMVRESHSARQSQHDAAIEQRASLYRLNVLLQATGTELQAH
ncbi:outer membrane protein, adhesin transport system [Roseateles sp. YR242]|nr:outer membrane protein, adhesin transport system [Roseateles sp. YR242]